MGDLQDGAAELVRRGPTAEERKTEAEDRIRYWIGQRDQARASHYRGGAEDCEKKIRYWSRRLRGLEERMRAALTTCQS